MTELLSQAMRQARKSPYYRTRLPATFAAAPLTTKADLRAHSPWGFLAVPKAELASYHESSGSTGEPTTSFFTAADWEDVVTRFLRNAVDIRPGDMVMVKTPYSLVTTAHQMQRAAEYRKAVVVPADNRSTNMPYRKVIELLQRAEVTVTWSLPTEVLIWAETAKQMGKDPKKDFPHLRAFLVAGEAMSPEKKKRMSEVWGGKPVFEDYGSTETGSLAGQCVAGNLHLWSDRLHFEVIDERLVVTTLYRQAMPLIRYCLEDAAVIETTECRCGSPYPMAKIRGRSESAITVQGRRFFPVDVESAVYTLDESHEVLFWRARHSADQLQVEIQTDDATAVETLRKLIQLRFGVHAEVTLNDEILPKALFQPAKPFLKPRFVFSAKENWNEAIQY